jgi:hypothetical protein
MKASFPDYIDGIKLEKVDGQQSEKQCRTATGSVTIVRSAVNLNE